MPPSCRTMPPIICTSKWRWPRVRLDASRVSAKVSYSSSSSGSPLRALVGWALDVARELARAEVDRVDHVPGGVAGARGHAFEVERALGHVGVGDRRVALLLALALHPRGGGDLLRDLPEPPLHVVP